MWTRPEQLWPEMGCGSSTDTVQPFRTEGDEEVKYQRHSPVGTDISYLSPSPRTICDHFHLHLSLLTHTHTLMENAPNCLQTIYDNFIGWNVEYIKVENPLMSKFNFRILNATQQNSLLSFMFVFCNFTFYILLYFLLLLTVFILHSHIFQSEPDKGLNVLCVS